jgi:hypothetical protein
LARHLQIGADPDPDHHFGADPEWILLIALMRIRIRILPFNLCGSGSVTMGLTDLFMSHGMGACMDVLASRCGERYRYPTEKEHIENN